MAKINVLEPNVWCRATEHIVEQIAMIKILEKKGYTYKTSDGIYFDTSKLKDYGKLTGMNFEKLSQTLKAGSRIEFSPEKKNITDFSLWKFSPNPPAGGVKRQMEWSSPWGIGFPGWHIECAVINLKFLGKAFQGKRFLPKKATTIDIHCGGIDHIPIHHTNEIAQVEAATGKKFVNYWLHGEFLKLPKARMGKSENNAILLSDLEKTSYSPLAFRYLVLNSHYRTPLEFSLEALKASQESLNNLYNFVYDCLWFSKKQKARKDQTFEIAKYQTEFKKAINDDLNTPQALAVLWQLNKKYYDSTNINPQAIYKLALEFDKILGLGLDKIKLIPLPLAIKKLLSLREKARQNKQWPQADQIRQKIEKAGFKVEDTFYGPKPKPLSWKI